MHRLPGCGTFSLLLRVMAVFLFCLPSSALAVGDSGCQRDGLPPNSVYSEQLSPPADLNADSAHDVQAHWKYRNAIREIRHNRQFAKLEELATTARRDKSRFAGGGWKLYAFYYSIAPEPLPGCSKVPARKWEDEIALVKEWIAAYPDSITPRISLAQLYYDYAWEARGSTYSNAVPESAWPLFYERLAVARKTLEDIPSEGRICPHWYSLMLVIGRSQGWALPELTAVFEKGIAFEPQYYPYYYWHTTNLMTKWFGKEGDAEAFAQEIADRIGGKEGDIIYYRIATDLNCRGCNQSKALFSSMSWPRIQAGYAATQERYGTSPVHQNSLARLAGRAGDREVAIRMFTEIGDLWDRDVWSRKTFEDVKAWAFAVPPEIETIWQAVNQNIQTVEGDQYQFKVIDAFNANHSADLKQCSEKEKEAREPFGVLLMIAADGSVQQSKAWPPTRLSACILPTVSRDRFPAPPTPARWVHVPVVTRPVEQVWGPNTGIPDVGE